MQLFIENFDFSKYHENQDSLFGQFKKVQDDVIVSKTDISHNQKIQTNTQINKNPCLSSISATCSSPLVNPVALFRLDGIAKVNDLVTFRNGESNWIVVGCSDGFLKVFAPLDSPKVIKAIKGISGSPICMDIAGLNHQPQLQQSSLQEQKDLLAVGFDDDSFTLYSIQRDF